MLVTRNALTGFSASVTANGTALQHWSGQWTLPGTQRRARFAALGAICTILRGLGVLGLAFTTESKTVFKARIAGAGTVAASFCTFRHMR